MAGISFIHFETWDQLQRYCESRRLRIDQSKNSPFIAEILNKNNAPVGFISDRVNDYKPAKPNSKYVLVWE